MKEDDTATAFAAEPSPLKSWTPPELLIQCLRRIRQHLGMELAFIAEFTEGRRVFRYVDSGASDLKILAGDSDPLEESYCARVADGRLPELMHNACLNAEALTLPATLALPVGAHLSVPIRLADGRVFGTLCCFSRRPDESLQDHDVATMRGLADVMADYFEHELAIRQTDA